MLKKRLIVSLIYADGFLVQSRNFSHTNVVGSLEISMEFFNIWEADEIILVNASRTNSYHDKFLSEVKQFSKLSFLPLSVGGWITSMDHVDQCFQSGADKVIVNTGLFENRNFAKEIVSKYGTQSLIASVDVRKSGDVYEVYTDRGSNNTGLDVIDWTKYLASIGIGEVFLTSIDNDGKKNGYDLTLMEKVSSNIEIPVIAFGGIYDFKDMVYCLARTQVSAVAAGNVFHYFEQSTKMAKKILIENDIDVRIPSNLK